MRLTFYGYNAFIVESGGTTVILDPGQDLHWRRLNALIPRQQWSRADLILVTHGDADHAEYVRQVAEASGAPIVCGPVLAARWQRKGLIALGVAPGRTVEAAGVPIQGIPVQHGGLTVTWFGCRLTLKPAFVGAGAIGLLFELDDRRLLNLGDTVLLKEVWRGLHPNVLMVPIGGMMTMDVDEALQAVTAIEPELVIPMHYDWDLLFYHRPADVGRFSDAVRAEGCQCLPLKPGQSAEI